MGNCKYQQTCDPKKPRNKLNTGIVGKTCKDARGVSGTCALDPVKNLFDCKATTAAGPSGGQSMSVGGLGDLLGAVSKILGALGAGQPPAGGGGSGGVSGGSQGCTQYYQVSTPTSDPCAYYVPQVSSSIDTSTGGTGGTGGTGSSNPISDLINSLTGGNSGSPNSSGSNTNNNTGGSNSNTSGGGTSTNSGNGVNTGTGTGGVSSTTAGQVTGIGPGGAKGDIRVLPDGTTVVITNQNSAGNSVIAGFLGMGANGASQSQGIAAELCRTRPWAKNFLSFIIPPVFFDSLCTLRGFQVGDAPVVSGGQPQVGVQTTIIRNPGPANPIVIPAVQPIIPAIPASPQMQVDIWATPAAVPLGTRTTIFWTSKNAAECVETSPDGSFSHSTLSGGGATVPLSGATTFTISCTALDGTHMTDFVTVNLAI